MSKALRKQVAMATFTFLLSLAMMIASVPAKAIAAETGESEGQIALEASDSDYDDVRTFTDDQGVEHECYRIDTVVTGTGGDVRILYWGDYGYEEAADGKLAYYDDETGCCYYDPSTGTRFSVYMEDESVYPISSVTYEVDGNEHGLSELDVERLYGDEPIYEIPAGLSGVVTIKVAFDCNVTIEDGVATDDEGKHAYLCSLQSDTDETFVYSVLSNGRGALTMDGEYYLWEGNTYRLELMPVSGRSMSGATLDEATDGTMSFDPKRWSVDVSLTSPATINITTAQANRLYNSYSNSYEYMLFTDAAWSYARDYMFELRENGSCESYFDADDAAADEGLSTALVIESALFDDTGDERDIESDGIADSQATLSVLAELLCEVDDPTIYSYNPETGALSAVTGVELTISPLQDSGGFDWAPCYEVTMTGSLSDLVGTFVIAGELAQITHVTLDCVELQAIIDWSMYYDSVEVGSDAYGKVEVTDETWTDLTTGEEYRWSDSPVFEDGHEYVYRVELTVTDGNSFGDEVTIYDSRNDLSLVAEPTDDPEVVSVTWPPVTPVFNPWERYQSMGFELGDLVPDPFGDGYAVLNRNKASLNADSLMWKYDDLPWEEQEAYREWLTGLHDSAYEAAGRNDDNDYFVWDWDAYDITMVDDDGNTIDLDAAGYEELAGTEASLIVRLGELDADVASAWIVRHDLETDETSVVADDVVVVGTYWDEFDVEHNDYGLVVQGTIAELMGRYSVVTCTNDTIVLIPAYDENNNYMGDYEYYEYETEVGNGVWFETYPEFGTDDSGPRRYVYGGNAVEDKMYFLASEGFEFATDVRMGYEITAVEYKINNGSWQQLEPTGKQVDYYGILRDLYRIENPGGKVTVRISSKPTYTVSDGVATFEDGSKAYHIALDLDRNPNPSSGTPEEYVIWVGYRDEGGVSAVVPLNNPETNMREWYVLEDCPVTFIFEAVIGRKLSSMELSPVGGSSGNTIQANINGGAATVKLHAPATLTVRTVVDTERWKRLAGTGRYDTMAAIVEEGFRGSGSVVIATGDNFPDALAASSLAGALGCPVVMTSKGSLSPQAAAQIKRLGAETAYVVGGTGAVSNAARNAIRALGVSVVPVEGGDRQGTSLAVMEKTFALTGGGSGTVVVATGFNFADALAIGPWCYSTATPILLAGKNRLLSPAQAAAAKDAGVDHVVIVGGNLAVDRAGVMRQLGLDPNDESAYDLVAGADRYGTAAAIVEFEVSQGMGFTHAAVATGANFPDALAGAALCGAYNSVLVLAANPSSPAIGVLVENGAYVGKGYFFGGPFAVSDSLAKYVEDHAK